MKEKMMNFSQLETKAKLEMIFKRKKRTKLKNKRVKKNYKRNQIRIFLKGLPLNINHLRILLIHHLIQL